MNEYQPGDNLRWQQEHNGTLNPAVAGEPVVTVEGRNYYTVPSTGYAICPECGATRPTERIADHMMSEHDSDCDEDGDFPAQGGALARYRALEIQRGRLEAAIAAQREDDEHAHDMAMWAKQWNPALYQKILKDQKDRAMKLTPREVTQLETALDEAEINHDTVKEQTGEDA
jgi:hypothetical protein